MNDRPHRVHEEPPSATAAAQRESAPPRREAAAAQLTLRDVTVRFGALAALDGIDLDVAAGERVCLLGPSGCGKTTLLRVVAGLEQPVSGRVCWDGRDITALPAHRRGFGLMFQEYALFPHRDVAGNVAFGLRMHGSSTGHISDRVREVLAMVDLAGYESRSVATLSGGEQQRVALARALAPSPHLLMLDEPLGSLDRSLRGELLAELRELLSRLRLPALWVTHDQDEAFAVADRVVVMRAGRVEAEGPPESLWRRPPTEFVARFLGFRNIVDAVVDGGRAATPWGSIAVAPDAPAGPRRLLVRPDALAVSADGRLEGIVVARTFRGDHAVLEVALPDAPSLEFVARGESVAGVGERVRLRLDERHTVLLG